MKVYEEELTNKSGVRGKRILFATNRKELELLTAILEKTYMYFPKCISTSVE